MCRIRGSNFFIIKVRCIYAFFTPNSHWGALFLCLWCNDRTKLIVKLIVLLFFKVVVFGCFIYYFLCSYVWFFWVCICCPYKRIDYLNLCVDDDKKMKFGQRYWLAAAHNNNCMRWYKERERMGRDLDLENEPVVYNIVLVLLFVQILRRFVRITKKEVLHYDYGKICEISLCVLCFRFWFTLFT